MTDLFSAHKARGTEIPTYFIESTAPDNVDDSSVRPSSLPDQLEAMPADRAIDEIAAHLAAAEHPNLVVMVHGFNNPEVAVLKAYARASQAVEKDAAIRARRGLVCIGYRWPSESMGQPPLGTLAALPAFPTWILWAGAILFAIYPVLDILFRFHSWRAALLGHLAMVLGGAFLGLVIALWLLRAVVYFRDGYRATNYGAPDLIDIIRQIDRAIIRIDQRKEGSETAAKARRHGHRAELSFIGHSMGGFVVTNAIRALSDVFAENALPSRLNAGVLDEEGGVPEVLPEIGNAFRLMRFVLASPDIPAETLLSGRANFLLASLRRFSEAYLFSSEGDEVLRLISTTANYFSFPTQSRRYGYRLGNVEILSEKYGIVDPGPGSFLARLRIGYYTLEQLYDQIRKARKEPPRASPADSAETGRSVQHVFPEVFTYFDCTDYVDVDCTQPGGQPTGLLTFALRTKQSDPERRMRWWNHVWLLWCYVLPQHKPNVHGGYFDGELCHQLIYRLACLGFADTVTAFGGSEDLVSKACAAKQIRVLLSPRLQGRAAPEFALARTAEPDPASADLLLPRQPAGEMGEIEVAKAERE